MAGPHFIQIQPRTPGGVVGEMWVLAQQINMNPTEHQQEIIGNVIQSLKNRESCCLSGKAGVGKTFCLSYIIRVLEVFRTRVTFYGRNSNSKVSNFIFTSPTHKASQNASMATGKTFVTLASLLKKKKEINFLTGQVIFDPTIQECEDEFYIVVDEASMISAEDEKTLLENFPNSVFLFVGDKYQLPSIPARKEDIFQSYPCFELTVNMRCGMGNPLYDYIEDVCMNGINVPIVESEKVQLVNRLDVTPQDTVVCYFNETCGKINRWVLDTYFDGTLQKGVRLVSNENIDPGTNGYRIYNSQFLNIEEVGKDQLTIYHLGKNEKVSVNQIWTDRGIVTTPLNNRFDEILSHYKTAGEWKRYYEIKAMCHDVGLGYGITSHKTQGSTYDEITVLKGDIQKCPIEVRNQSYYVAVSRAANKLKIIL